MFIILLAISLVHVRNHLDLTDFELKWFSEFDFEVSAFNPHSPFWVLVSMMVFFMPQSISSGKYSGKAKVVDSIYKP